MNTVREYRMPLLIGAGALVAALLVWLAFVSPQTSKLSSLQNQETQLQSQESSLQVKLATLRTEKENLTKSCKDLEKIATQIPSVQSPTDVDAEESSFESQFNGLAETSGVTLTQFSGFTPATPAAATPSASSKSTAGVVAVPTTLAVTGNYGQMTSFIKGLDSFPRLFVIQTFGLAFGTSAASGSSSSGSSSSSASTGSSASSGSGSSSGPPLWVGGTTTSPSAGPYSLSITGSIYYTTTPNALNVCTKATATTVR
jgi:Tfp pilus assembly protein PilO